MRGRCGLASSRNTGGSDRPATALQEVSALAGSTRRAPSLRSFAGAGDIDARCDRMLAAFLNHRIVTHLLRQFSLAGLDLGVLTVAKPIWDRCSTSTVVPPLPAGPDGRIRLDTIAAALSAHQALQHGIVMLLARSFPGSFLLMFGQGIALAHPGYTERFSHDIDLHVADPARGQAIVDALLDQGFGTPGPRYGSYGGVAFRDWRLDAENFGGHRMHIDISTAAVTNTNLWMHPLLLPDLFDAAQAVTVADADPHPVLVPSDTHQLVLVCEKAQRKHRYDARVRCDATVLVRDRVLDEAAVAETTRQAGLAASLRWALGTDQAWYDQGHRGWRDRTSSALIAAMAHGTYSPSPVHAGAARLFRRLWA
jgi:hypothetical protein